MTDTFHLARFVEAQENYYETALAEMHAGQKWSHWIWFIFPQLKGLGSSANADYYGLSGLEEAGAYLTHPLLGPRLREATATMLAQPSSDAAAVLGRLDAMKFRSCLTLFAQATPAEPVFAEALQRFFAGEPDARTLEMLGRG